MAGAKKAAVAVLFATALVLGVMLARSMIAKEDTAAIGTFHGVKLGMTAAAVRERFQEPTLGTWQAMPQTGAGDVVLAWAAVKGGQRTELELHNGMLVAVRATIAKGDPEGQGAPVEVSRAVVRTRAVDGDLVKVLILARDCPTHHEEAEKLAAGH